MASKPAKRHHLVPKFYLKAFAAEANIRVQVIGGKSYVSSAAKAFTVNDFYKTSEAEDSSLLEFEEHLSGVESRAADSLRKLGNLKRIGRQDKSDIAEFLLAQWVRGEDFRLASNSFNNLAIRDMARHSAEEDVRLFHELMFGRMTSDDEWELLWQRYLSNEGPGFLSTVANNFSQLRSLTMESKKALLLIRRWTVIHFQQPSLISGDRPVVLADLKRTARSVVSPGLANTPQVIFPMNRSMALVLELEHNKETVFEMIERLQSVYWVAGNKQQADQINHLIVLNSRDKIFGHPSDSERLLKLSELLEPISNWKTSSDWSEATQRLLALMETIVNLFRDTSRDDIARMLAKSQSSGGSSDSFFQDF